MEGRGQKRQLAQLEVGALVDEFFGAAVDDVSERYDADVHFLRSVTQGILAHIRRTEGVENVDPACAEHRGEAAPLARPEVPRCFERGEALVGTMKQPAPSPKRTRHLHQASDATRPLQDAAAVHAVVASVKKQRPLRTPRSKSRSRSRPPPRSGSASSTPRVRRALEPALAAASPAASPSAGPRALLERMEKLSLQHTKTPRSAKKAAVRAPASSLAEETREEPDAEKTRNPFASFLAKPNPSPPKIQASDPAEIQAKALAEARARADERAKAESEAKAKKDAEARAEAEARRVLEAEAQARARADLEARAKADADEKAAKAQREAEARAKVEADARAKMEAEVRAKIEREAAAARAAAEYAAAARAASTTAPATPGFSKLPVAPELPATPLAHHDRPAASAVDEGLSVSGQKKVVDLEAKRRVQAKAKQEAWASEERKYAAALRERTAQRATAHGTAAMSKASERRSPHTPAGPAASYTITPRASEAHRLAQATPSSTPPPASPAPAPEQYALPYSATGGGMVAQPVAGIPGVPVASAAMMAGLPEDFQQAPVSTTRPSRSRRKQIPNWAKSTMLMNALTRQFHEGRDPDTMFPPFVDTATGTLDLGAIFESNVLPQDRRFSARTSSGNWLRDGLRPAEMLQYNRDMGFDVSLDEDDGDADA